MESIGRYEVVRPLGRGGMGQVYLARDPKLERQVAIKLLVRDDGDDTRALFEREAKALAALNHPNIVTVYEIAEAPGGQFIVMEYLPGRALRDLLQGAPPARNDLVAICGQVATALGAAHDAGILHRDIKPENVVVGKNLSVKVVDFGIARRLDSPSLDPSTARRGTPDVSARAATIVDVFTRTVRVGDTAGRSPATLATDASPVTSMTRTVFGTPAYMAPEVLMGEPSSTASDVYSLGVMLHECLTGRRPYEAPNLHEVIARVIDGGDAPPALDDPLADLVARMIARDPQARPKLGEIAKTLSRRRSTIAAPSSPSRRRWLVPAAVLSVVGLGGAAIAISQRASPARTHRTIAIRDLDLVWIPSYGNPPVARAFTETLVRLVDSSDVEVIPPEVMRRGAPATPDAWADNARSANATLIASGHIVETAGRLVARFDVVDLATGELERVQLLGDPDRTAALLHDAASWLVAVARPGETLPVIDRALATTLVKDGARELDEHHASQARTFLEQAVTADPGSSEAWDHYATSLAMMAAKQETIERAAGSAYSLASAGPSKRLRHAKQLIFLGRFEQALRELAPLEAAGLAGDDLRDLMFLLGETHWHEGRHDRGYEYFKRTLELDPTFAEAGTHAGEYAVARRDGIAAREYARVQRIPVEHIDFALGHYEKVAKSGKEPYASWANVVLGRPSRLRESFGGHPEIYDRLTEAAAVNDRLAAGRAVDVLLTQLEPFTNLTSSGLVEMTEVLLVAEMPEQARRILEVLRTRQPRYNYKRLSILAGPWLGAPNFDRDVLTERLAELVRAIDAELAGDRATAARLLDELVKNPTYEWDFVERFALIRNLRALGEVARAEAICADTLKPPLVRYVFVVARARCLAR